ncbi:MAG: PqqD family peptide modification chaperone [Armatimonadota bacterium]|nr:PqqD family peptide modification chaperone [Armatimonadota bacterium]
MLRWYGETRFNPNLDEDLVAQLARAGMRIIQFGLESYNQRVLDLMDKGVKLADIVPVLKRCLARGIGYHLFCFLGFPGETAEDAERTLTFLDEISKLTTREFGNQHCSNGVGIFRLDVLSRVAQDPARFGVHILPPADEDELSPERRYEVEQGLSQETAAEILRRWVGQDLIDEAYRVVGRVPLKRTLGFKERWEEWNFLRSCYQEAGVKPSRQIPKGNKWFELRDMPEDPLSGARGPVAVAYHVGYRHLVLLSRVDAAVLHRVYSHSFGTKQIPRRDADLVALPYPYADIAGSICRLRRSGFVSNAYIAANPEEDVSLIPVRAPGVVYLRVRPGAFVLLDVDTERVFRLNAAGALIWLSVDGRLTLHELSTELWRRAGVTAAEFSFMLRQMSDRGLVYFVPWGTVQRVPQIGESGA